VVEEKPKNMILYVMLEGYVYCLWQPGEKQPFDNKKGKWSGLKSGESTNTEDESRRCLW